MHACTHILTYRPHRLPNHLHTHTHVPSSPLTQLQEDQGASTMAMIAADEKAVSANEKDPDRAQKDLANQIGESM